MLAVIDSLKLKTPVLIGHSFAGQEMSNVAARYAERIAGVVYVDAAHSWDEGYEAGAFYKIVEWKDQLNDFERKFHELMDEPLIPDRWLSRCCAKTCQSFRPSSKNSCGSRTAARRGPIQHPRTSKTFARFKLGTSAEQR